MTDNENIWDKLLQIKTTGRDDSNSDQYRYPYEPTPYSVLERLANSGFIRKKDVVLDYGCGKGRVDFFLSYQTKATTIGIEYDERIYQSSLENQKTAISKARTEFILARAEEYEVPSEVNRYYFFNPFSVELLRKVMATVNYLYGFVLCLWRRQRQPTPVLLPGQSHGWRSLLGCSPWGR